MEEEKENHGGKSNNNELPEPLIDNNIKKDIINLGGSVVGALTGFAIGGPIGAMTGASISPISTIAYNIISGAINRRRIKTEQVFERALEIANISEEEVVNIINSDENKADDLIRLLRISSEADPEINTVLSAIIAKLLSVEDIERERLMIICDALRNMKSIHFRILYELEENNGILFASEIASAVKIPEIELRSVVRDLELKGMIEDLGISPTKWRTRELGKAIVTFINQ